MNGEPEQTEFEAPEPVLVRRRWIPPHRVEWAQNAHRIMLEHGEVRGNNAYEKRRAAQWRAQKLMSLLVDLEMVEPWQISEHTFRRGQGWGWCVEYHGGAHA